ncbi:MAG: Gfo/Idh/MocA family oxidoreductase [Verrucomicrobiae bacterium]|nr:Gfo/Idh/MocA family oxidoreductase [Verrucomicrobiae bacterium]
MSKTGKVKLGIVGCGERGNQLAALFKEHGGYELHALADYFPEVVQETGKTFGVEPSRCFSGLGGCKKLLASGVEAVALVAPPYFLPEHAAAAVAAGCHVFVAFPVAVDVPGCIQILGLAKENRCVFVDTQITSDPTNVEIAQRIRDGGLGKLAFIATVGCGGGKADPPKTATIESRLREGIWMADVALGGGRIVCFDVHALEAALWVAGARPVSAMGKSRICRPEPHGDMHDVTEVIYEFADGLVLNHCSQALKNNAPERLTCVVYGTLAHAEINYWGRSFLKGGPKHFGGGAVDSDGAKRSVAAFHKAICEKDFSNPSVARAGDATLTAVLGREAAARGVKLTMDELLRENKSLDLDLGGLRI